jgi:hypothetical protein
MTRHLLVACAIVLGSVHGIAQQPTSPETTKTPSASTLKGPLLGDYFGLLPCAKCLGPTLRAELLLHAAGDGVTNYGTYALVQSFVARRGGLQWIETSGRWVLIYGSPEDANAHIYQLTAADPSTAPQYFLRVSDEALRVVDAQRRPFATVGTTTLVRVPLRVLGQQAR